MTPPSVLTPPSATTLPLHTPLGEFVLHAAGTQLVGIELPVDVEKSRRGAAAEVAGPGESAPSRMVLDEAARQLREYMAGGRTDFDLPVAFSGTAFQEEVWAELVRIPYGTTITYGELARRVGRAGAARAVGQANGRNPVPIVVPCHRVVASDGIGGYGGGLPLKRALLALEGVKA